MADEEDNSTSRQQLIDEVRVRAMKGWAAKVDEAIHAWTTELNRACRDTGLEDLTPDEAASAEERTVINLSMWLSQVFAMRESIELHPDTAMHIHRLEDAQYHVNDGPKIALAVRIVREHGDRYLARRDWLNRGLEYKGNTPEEIARQLWVGLFAGVDPQFRELEHKTEQIIGLLERYESDRTKRDKINPGRTSKIDSLIDANGVLVELSNLAKWRKLSSNRVSNAVLEFSP